MVMVNCAHRLIVPYILIKFRKISQRASELLSRHDLRTKIYKGVKLYLKVRRS